MDISSLSHFYKHKAQYQFIFCENQCLISVQMLYCNLFHNMFHGIWSNKYFQLLN